MKMKSLLAALIAFAAATDVPGLTRSYDGSGEAILLPYFHVANGEATLFTITNHSDKVKAVRVVVAEGRNGRQTLSFNLYLAARDSWSAALAPHNGPRAHLSAADDSCTVPLISDFKIPIQDYAYRGSREDGLGADEQRLQHGLIEVIELGVPTGLAAQAIETQQCVTLVQRFTLDNGAWRHAPNADVDAPSGGLTAEAQIVDVAGGVAYRIEPVILDDFSFAPRHGRADVEPVRFYEPTASPAAGAFEVGRARISIDRPADAVSLTLMSTAFEAGFLLSKSLSASTRMIVAFPTRPAYLDNLPGGELTLGTPPLAPFTGVTATKPYCVDSEWQALSRDGNAGTVTVLPLCEQVNVVDLSQDAGEGGGVVTAGETGRVRIGLQRQPHALPYDIPGSTGEIHFAHGLPAVVQSLTEVRNTNAQPGLLASYAISHRALRETEYDTDF